MNFKRSTTSLAIVLMALSLVSIASTQQDAFATGFGISMTATADKGSDTILVEGQTLSDVTDITFRVTSPSGNNIVAVGQISPDDNGYFATEFKISPMWTEDGFYTIRAEQGQSSLYTLTVFVEVTNGMAEKTSVTESNLDTGIFKPIEPNVARDVGFELDEIDIVFGSAMFEVTGMTGKTSQPITLTVTSPNGNVVTIGQESPLLDGTFSAEITTGGPLWKQDGFYTVTAQQGDQVDSVQVDIENGVVVPEFGTIAAMILAVAIISIIAISARSRLSIIPRY